MHGTANFTIGINYYVMIYDICETMSRSESHAYANATWSQCLQITKKMISLVRGGI